MAAHGGTVSANSGAGQGMTVTVLLPMTRTETDRPELGHPELEHPELEHSASQDAESTPTIESATSSTTLEAHDGAHHDAATPTSQNGAAGIELTETPTTNGSAAPAPAAPVAEPHAYPALPPDAAS